MNEFFAVVMAGGRGERFWPASRGTRPKQLLKIFGTSTLLEAALARLRPLVSPERILVITNRNYVAPVRALFPELPSENVVGEPEGRDTAPCVALAAGIVGARAGRGAVMLVVPADPLIRDNEAFADDVRTGCRLAAERAGRMVTIGVEPEFPSTAYGYIECGAALDAGGRTFQVRRFREKPDAAAAAEFVASGGFLWNCGMFFWRVDTIMAELERHAPALARFAAAAERHWATPGWEDFLERNFPACPRISIDYAVLEHGSDIVGLRAGFDWDDVGNWTSLRGHFPADSNGNVLVGSGELLECGDCVVFNPQPGHTLCAIGVNDLVMVHTPDATLICPAERTGEIKNLLSRLAGDPERKKLI